MSKTLPHLILALGAPRRGAARERRTSVLPAGQNLGAGRIHSARASEMMGVPAKPVALWGGQEEDAEFGNGAAADRGVYGGAQIG